MKNLLEYLYVYDLEVIREARSSLISVLEDSKSATQNMLLNWYMFDRQIIAETEDGIVATICGKPV